MSQSPVAFLENLLHAGKVENGFPQRFEKFMANPDTWFFKQCEADGSSDAAYAKLLEQAWVREGEVYGPAVRNIVEAMLEVARADTQAKLAYYREPRYDDGRFPLFLNHDYRQAVVVLNPEYAGCGCTAPDSYGVWGTNGALQLIGAVIGVSERSGVELGLIFPMRKTGDYADAGFTTISITPHGRASGSTWYRKSTPKAMALEALGIGVEPFGGHTGGSIGSHLGFPDAEAYLLKHLPSLAPYLQAMAHQLSGEHSH